MTLSKDGRLENIELALRLMLAKLGDGALYRESFNPEDPTLSAIRTTSWKELEDRFLVRGTHGSNFDYYELTGLGWFCAMEMDGKFDTPEFEEQFGKLSASLKGYVKGRRDKQITTIEAVAQNTGSPPDFIYNVIKARVWKHKFNRIGAEFDNEGIIWIPINFGM